MTSQSYCLRGRGVRSVQIDPSAAKVVSVQYSELCISLLGLYFVTFVQNTVALFLNKKAPATSAEKLFNVSFCIGFQNSHP